MATILGTPGPNVINGTNDPGDVIFARAGHDLVNANAGNDLVFGELGNDVLVGGLGDDRLSGGVGNDTLNGGTGIDTADYSSGTIDPPGPVGPQVYSGATAGVTVNLTLAGAQNTGGAGSDTLVSIENLIGTNFNDTLTGNSANNGLLGLAGNDILNGGSGDDWLIGGTGNDLLNGGAGLDTADYRNLIGGIGATAGVTVNLNLTSAQNTGGAGSDTLVSIENLTGTNFNDSLTGNGANNVLSGENGNDQLNGGNGNDTLHGGGNNDQLFGGNGNDLLTGGTGNDLLDGGAGLDTASYAKATAGVKVIFDFGDPFAPKNTGGAGIDTLLNIENLIGSNFNDQLGGSLWDNSTVNGGAGNDVLSLDHSGATLNGGSGDDKLTASDSGGTLNGGDGNDWLSVGNGDCTLNGDDGNDLLEIDILVAATLNGGGGNDTLIASGPSGTLNGGDGNDVLKILYTYDSTLNGGAGADTLEIVGGSDFATGTGTFDYNAVSDSPAGAGKDMIIGFVGKGASVGDKIDLFTIDANTLVTGNQAFTWKGATPGGAGTLWYANGILNGNTDGDAAVEFQIQLVGTPTLFVQAGNPGSDILL